MTTNTLHNYFFIVNKNVLKRLKRFLLRYVLPHIRTRICMVCYDTTRTVYNFCICSFMKCSVCFSKIVTECPQCRCDHEIVNNKKKIILIEERQYLNQLLYRTWDKPNIQHIISNIHMMRQQNEEKTNRCNDIIHLVENVKNRKKQRTDYFVDLLYSAFSNDEDSNHNIFTMLFRHT